MTLESILESIENSKDIARIKMSESRSQVEKEYYVGMIGGLSIAKQHLEKEFGHNG